MSVNLSQYQSQLLDAWKDVVNDKTSTDWALFGYEKQTNNLKVVSVGDGGLEELVDELNSGKIMYAFCRVIDPKTGLPKFVFINWQGEGAPMSRKGTCANHVATVSNFFKGAHVTINARTEDDVEPEVVLEKVAKASASQFNFKDRSDPVENIAPVGSVYKRIQPTKEINPVERERFWEKEQAEEKERIIREKKKADEERKKLEQERREREVRDNTAREEVVMQRIRSISAVKESQRNADLNAKAMEHEKQQWEKQLQDDQQYEIERKIRSESLRRERSYEAQALISKRTINARAIFEQNTCAGQLSSTHAVKQSKLIQNFEMQFSQDEESMPEKNLNNRTEMPKHPEAEDHSNQEISSKEIPPDFNYTKNLLKEGLPPRQDSEVEPNAEEEQNWDEPTLEAPPDVRDPLTEMLAEHGIVRQTQDTNQVIISSNTNDGLKARALYDYQAADETEISFDPDDIITQIEQIDEGWWQGLAPDGTYGLFPANYVELLD